MFERLQIKNFLGMELIVDIELAGVIAGINSAVSQISLALTNDLNLPKLKYRLSGSESPIRNYLVTLNKPIHPKSEIH